MGCAAYGQKFKHSSTTVRNNEKLGADQNKIRLASIQCRLFCIKKQVYENYKIKI